MGKFVLLAIALCCNVLHLSNAGSPLDLDVFQSLTGDNKGFEVITAAKISKASKSIKRKINSIDVCFLVDTTGSMRPHIQAVRDSIRDTVNGLVAKAVKTVRMSFVGYRDFVDKGKKIQIIPFTTNVDDFLRKVEAIPATGGGDFHEDVYTGLQEAAKRGWSSQKRVILHMADAPCHGPGCTDSTDTADPLGRDIEGIFTAVRVKKLFYTFGRINLRTDPMLTTFAGAYGRKIPVFEVASSGSSSGASGSSGGKFSKFSKKLGIKAAGSRRAELKRKVGEATFGAAILAITD